MLPPIITRCFDETINSENKFEATQTYIHILPGAGHGEEHMEGTYDQDISRWSSSTEDSRSNYSNLSPEETYEETLERRQRFFDNCLEYGEDIMIADRLFERLLKEVQQPGLPFEGDNRQSRGEAQVRAFWDDVRRQLIFDEDFVDS